MNDTKRKSVNWRRVGLFLALTFGLTYLLDGMIWLSAGYGPRALVALQFQMLLPAFCAIVLGMYVFADSPLYQMRANRERPRLFFFYYIACTIIIGVVALLPLFSEGQTVLVFASTVAQLLGMLGVAVLIGAHILSGREASARVSLSGGRWIYWLGFSAGTLAFYALMAALNAAFRLGETVDLADMLAQSLPSGETSMAPLTFALIVGVQAVLLGPFLGLLFGFGEEYGWRGFLQGELVGFGKVRGVLLVGLIWGLWHAPVIAMGHNYPGYPVAGVLLMTAYTIGLAFVLGYAVLKSGSVLLAAYLHALNNQVWSFLTTLVHRPSDPVFSFGTGLYGVAALAVVGGLILLDPVWRRGEGLGPRAIERRP
jgi:membrane protease YdiL (CAAX protease family)